MSAERYFLSNRLSDVAAGFAVTLFGGSEVDRAWIETERKCEKIPTRNARMSASN